MRPERAITTHLHLVPMIRMSGAISLLTLYGSWHAHGQFLTFFKLYIEHIFVLLFRPLSTCPLYVLLLHLVTISDTHTRSVRLLWMNDRPVAKTTHSTYKRQTSPTPARFKPAVPSSEQRQFHPLRWVHTCNVTAYRNAVTLQVTDTILSYELNFHPVPHRVTVSRERYALGSPVCYGSPSDVFTVSSGFIHSYILLFKLLTPELYI
jgi:hypothetical protein